VRSGARRSRATNMATRTRASPRHRRLLHQHRHRGRQRLRRDGGSAHRRHALLHITDKSTCPSSTRPQLYSRSEDQLTMLRSVSKRAYRVWSADTLLGTLREAVAVALTPPMGPVSIEIPIDVQGAAMDMPRSTNCCRCRGRAHARHPFARVTRARIARRETPAAVVGGGARGASVPVRALAKLGWGVVTSAAAAVSCPKTTRVARFVHDVAAVEALYRTCDAMS